MRATPVGADGASRFRNCARVASFRIQPARPPYAPVGTTNVVVAPPWRRKRSIEIAFVLVPAPFARPATASDDEYVTFADPRDGRLIATSDVPPAIADVAKPNATMPASATAPSMRGG